MTQRDTFISNLFEKAKQDKDIIMISVDMGAPTLDIWRETLPDQFIAAGISEQNAINVAAGLSSQGKKVYVYFMASWVGRCWEQIRYSCAMADNPITILGNGVALGYAPAGPAHEPTEDIAYMRSINHIEIHSPANNNVVKALVDLTLEEPKLRYLRLERKFASEVEDLYPNMSLHAILTNGYMLGRGYKVWQQLIENGYEVSLYDVWKLKPLNSDLLQQNLKRYSHLVTIEEQSLDGGFGSIISEFICDNQLSFKLLRLGLPEKFIFENGTRDHLIDTHGLSVKEIYNNITNFVQ
jgi:transketolase